MHPFITTNSYILYRKTRIEGSQTLLNGVNEGIFVPKELMPDEPFARICAGITASPHTPLAHKKYYEDNS